MGELTAVTTWRWMSLAEMSWAFQRQSIGFSVGR